MFECVFYGSIVCIALWVAWYIIAPPMKRISTGFLTREYMSLAGHVQFIEDVLYRGRNRFPIPDASGKVAVVTGGGRGIGLEVTRILMKSGMTVVMAVRRPETVLETAEKLMKEFPHAKADVLELDLGVLESVRNFAKSVTSKYPRINVLVNNAGIFDTTWMTEDGFNACLVTNYLGPLYLIHFLLPSLRKAGEESETYSRVVNVCSIAHVGGAIRFDDINLTKNFNAGIAYAQSKVALLMFTRTLDRLLDRQMDKVHAYAVDPGLCFTDMVKSIAPSFSHFYFRFAYKSAEGGGTSVAYCCLSPKLEHQGGKYFANCGETWSTGYSRDYMTQQKLFAASCKMVKIAENDFGNPG